jgi:hypothetical protein
MKKVNFLLGILFLMTSCGFYSAMYKATYTIQSTKNSENTREISIDFINNLADKNSLSKDTRYNDTDTLAFFGKPYHYFKFWLEQNDSNTVFNLDYWGMFGSRKIIHYSNLFNELNNFVNINFIILEQDIKEKNNAKNKK